MKKLLITFPALLFLFLLAGCNAIEGKAVGLSIIYGIMAVFSLLLLVLYCCLTIKKEPWFLVLFSSVLIVNVGYLALAVSSTLAEALLANRISYLGAVCLPLSMLMIILSVCKINCRKWVPLLLICFSAFVLFVAMSPGYLDIYYKEVSLDIVDGVSSLQKVYGPWHFLYYVYLFSYFGLMIFAIAFSIAKKQLESTGHAAILAIAVFVNIGVWLIEQVVDINFEILSVSYVITEMFLLGLHILLKEQSNRIADYGAKNSISGTTEQLPAQETQVSASATDAGAPSTDEEMHKQFIAGVASLTPTELSIYHFYLDQKSTKEVMELLNIKENTLKFHNKNIYGKLGVSSRKQLVAMAQKINN